MPVFNEGPTVERAIRSVLDTDLGVSKELILVDDGSTDGTRELLERLELPDAVRLHLHPANRGKGAAVRTALADARGELTTIFDADLEYDVSDIASLLEPLLEGRSNAVFGVRAFEGHTSHSFLYVMGNRGVTLVANLAFNVYLKDVMTCHKAIRTDIFKALPLRANGFEIEPEIAGRLLQHGERIYEVPVNYRARSHEEGKKLTATDGLRSVATILRCRLFPSR
jgi:glycosyltransferase involved in cell wall biosynthesis